MIDVAQIVERLLGDLNDRSGFDIGGLPDEVLDEIRAEWTRIICQEIGGSA